MLNALSYYQCVAQGLGPLLFPQRLSHGTYSAEETQRMKAVCVHNIQLQTQMMDVLERAWKALEKAEIPTVVLKGVGLAALYDDPSLRSWGDIDLFVGKKNYHPACAVMRKTFPEALKFDEELEHYKHYNLIADGVSIELHRISASLSHPRDIRRYQRMEEEGMKHACELKIGELLLRIPEPTFNALFVFLHSWEHMITAGANARQLYDLRMVLHRYHAQIDAKRLKRYLQQLCLLDSWQLYSYIMVQYLELSQNEALFYNPQVAQRAERLFEDLLAGRMNTPHAQTQAPKNRFARKWYTMQERMKNARRISLYSPSCARHMRAGIWLSGLRRLFAKDRHWE